MNDDESPPLAPEDRPLDDAPLARSRWWIAIAVIIVLALILALASPIFAW